MSRNLYKEKNILNGGNTVIRNSEKPMQMGKKKSAGYEADTMY